MLSEKAKCLMDNPIEVSETPDKVRDAFGDNVKEFMKYVGRWGRVNQFPRALDFAKVYNPLAFGLYSGMPSDEITAFVKEAFEHRGAWDTVREYLAQNELDEVPREFIPFIQAVMRNDPPPKYTATDRHGVFNGLNSECLEDEIEKKVVVGQNPALTVWNKSDRDRFIHRLSHILVADYGLQVMRDKRERRDVDTVSDVIADVTGISPDRIMNILSSQKTKNRRE